jgi:rare lipoprotein A (peptidoglycan hydrolase)
MHPSMLRKGRVIDLSGVGAHQLKTKSSGIVKVRLEAIGYSQTNPVN